MNSDNNQEMFPLVDEQGNITGAATRGECHNGSKLLHPVIHLHVFNSKGELYMQKRPEWKSLTLRLKRLRIMYSSPHAKKNSSLCTRPYTMVR